MKMWDELSERRARRRLEIGLAQMPRDATEPVFDRTDVRMPDDATRLPGYPQGDPDRHENGRGKSDVENAAALDAIAALLDGREWDGADLRTVADLVRRTGREIASPLPDAVVDLPVPNREEKA